MKAHVQNPWTRSPSLMVNVSVEEAQQLLAALELLARVYLTQPDHIAPDHILTSNQRDAFEQMTNTLQHALNTARPHGIKGVLP